MKDYPYFPLTATIAPVTDSDTNPQEVQYAVSEDWSVIEGKLPVTIRVLNDIASGLFSFLFFFLFSFFLFS